MPKIATIVVFFVVTISVAFLTIFVHDQLFQPKPEITIGIFGLDMGTPLKNVSVIKAMDAKLFEVKAPNPDSKYSRYMIEYASGVGICSVSGISEPMAEEDFKFFYNSVKYELIENYGGALVENDRLLWSISNNKFLPPNVDVISVSTFHSSVGNVLITTYMYKNMMSCDNVKIPMSIS